MSGAEQLLGKLIDSSGYGSAYVGADEASCFRQSSHAIAGGCAQLTPTVRRR